MSNQPAFPISFDTLSNLSGLTKREYFAANAMQGLLASNATYGGSTNNRTALAKDAIAFADALLKELDSIT